MGENRQSSLGLDENVAGALCYVLGAITGIIFYILEKDSDFVRFHAVQSIIVFGALFILNTVVTMISASIYSVPLAGMVFAGVLGLVSTVIFLVALILWILLMVKAYQGDRYRVPIAGKYAERYVYM